ncbi:MAG: hypothetical protein IJ368_10600, partial [Oscillospiraceae bacterium]|nr:hypothetical protein [Oscillospiraceae bacterium]
MFHGLLYTFDNSLIYERRQGKMKKLYFITGSQDLYGEETLRQAQEHGRIMAEYISSQLGETAEVTAMPIVRNS